MEKLLFQTIDAPLLYHNNEKSQILAFGTLKRIIGQGLYCILLHEHELYFMSDFVLRECLYNCPPSLVFFFFEAMLGMTSGRSTHTVDLTGRRYEASNLSDSTTAGGWVGLTALLSWLQTSNFGKQKLTSLEHCFIQKPIC